MVALRLSDQPRPLSQYSIVGFYSPGRGDFVQHVALLQKDHEAVCYGHDVIVHHMRPPLSVAGDDACPAHVAGAIEDLSPDERASILTWLDDVRTKVEEATGLREGFARQYTIIPPSREWQVDAPSGNRRFLRFSCVGFIHSCFAEAVEIALLELDEGSLPQVDAELLEAAYGMNLKLFGKIGRSCGIDDLPAQLGIAGEPPFPVALAGYLFHALSRPTQEVRTVPYVPSGVSDGWFPSPNQETQENGTLHEL